jgi:hypothetical protein
VVQLDDVPVMQVSNFTVCNNLQLHGNIRTDKTVHKYENVMSDTTSKGNVQSVAGSSAQCHEVTPAQCAVSLVAMLQQVAAEW